MGVTEKANEVFGSKPLTREQKLNQIINEKTSDKSDHYPGNINDPAFLMCAPFYMTSDVPNNVWMNEIPDEKKKIDFEVAHAQFMELYNYVSGSALTYILPSQPGLQDQVYTANLGIVLPHLKEKTVVISNYKSAPRVKESEYGKLFYEMMGYNVVMCPYYFEGEADLKWLNGNVYIGAHGIRTDEKAHRWFEETFDMKVITVNMEDEYLYHLDCMIFPLTREKTLVAVDLIEEETLAELEKYTEIIEVEESSAYCGITNCVRLGSVIMAASNLEDLTPKDGEEYEDEKYNVEELTEICIENGFEPVFFNLSEFYKSGAMLSCMFMHLNYNNYSN